ncbi:ABC transporter ATP-binding protein/permease [Mycobacterium lepromatosis]|uniref:Multidrug resistance pump n=1 Tax=Mycobacterium lepromatosis TaxID=480418 RepID=A0A0F4EPI4_9MYCO|nr:ABC transporter ATP-binding protein/permease [Mycobacterium lepromatosis]KJX74803.1 multidrug resistance pump [Mycobacterium lepromatosis]UKN43042.1 multidrug ABC transporter ATP-binding protein [Mycobacterium lepromatosis]
MELRPFHPSVNWGHALPDSLWWIAKAWAISAICVFVLVVLSFTTRWGRQYWRITRGYFTGPQSVGVWLMLAVLLLSVVTNVRLNVLFSYQSKDLYNALQAAFEGAGAQNDLVKQSGMHGFWMSLGIFSILAVIFITRVMADIYLTQRFIIAWRVWLTDHLTTDWLDQCAYYREQFIENTIDNPDQRIQQDIDIFTAGGGGTPNVPSNGTGSTLLFGAVESVISMISFTAILWNLSGRLDVFEFEIPRAMFWIVIVYVLLATIMTFRIGRPLIGLNFANEKLNAAFRYALVRLRDAAEAVAFYRGEEAEQKQLERRFTPIIDNYRKYVSRTIGFLGWNTSVSQIIVPLPWILQAPRLFAGKINLGDVGQTATAFGNIHESLSFFRNNYAAFAAFRAAIIRLHGLVVANARSRELPHVTAKSTDDGTVHVAAVEVRTPAGDQLIYSLDLQLNCGDSLVITGCSGVGKTTMLRSLAELWPYASGTLSRPGGKNETMFLSQLPYVPLGNLRGVVCYPNSSADIPEDTVRNTLTKVALNPLCDRLDEEQDWAKVLSPGEQQRIAFARILLTKPKAIFLDESTSALDEGLEFALYQMLRIELPDCIVVSVSHRRAVELLHERQLELLGDGQWRLGPVEKKPLHV